MLKFKLGAQPIIWSNDDFDDLVVFDMVGELAADAAIGADRIHLLVRRDQRGVLRRR